MKKSEHNKHYIKNKILLFAACVLTAGLTAGTLQTAAGEQAKYDNYVGKTFSICGDSISTFEGYTYTDLNYYPKDTDVDIPLKTWWGQMSGMTGMKLLSDSSVGGSTVCGNPNDPEGKCFTSDLRLTRLMNLEGEKPDVIFVEGGVNDMAQNRVLVPDTFQQAVINLNDPEGPDNIIVFSDAYDLLLTKISNLYPDAEIICLTCETIATFDNADRTSWYEPKNGFGATVEDFNQVIRTVAAYHGVRVIDTHECGITQENVGLLMQEDGLHPNATGCMMIGQYVAGHMNNSSAY
ncbi:MAG: SGNH/GDSL hydrolase family protein [Lachnospiraceae bacterium]|jgi:lysophospholipase L1-like esterase|nr:SGNH/GDSL hydrolase family protein [Lachnospiraceae bacterium]MDD4524440.1 SGNH/GDSL hydrolase family protein [Lachnospiraceae bacterium]